MGISLCYKILDRAFDTILSIKIYLMGTPRSSHCPAPAGLVQLNWTCIIMSMCWFWPTQTQYFCCKSRESPESRDNSFSSTLLHLLYCCNCEVPTTISWYWIKLAAVDERGGHIKSIYAANVLTRFNVLIA